MSNGTGTITIYGSDTDISDSMPLITEIEALSDTVSASLEFWKLKPKISLIDDGYTDANGSKSGNFTFDDEFVIESKDLDYANQDYYIDFHEIYKPLKKRYRWLKVDTNYMYRLIDSSLTGDRAIAVHLQSIEEQASESEKVFYDITFTKRK